MIQDLINRQRSRILDLMNSSTVMSYGDRASHELAIRHAVSCLRDLEGIGRDEQVNSQRNGGALKSLPLQPQYGYPNIPNRYQKASDD